MKKRIISLLVIAVLVSTAICISSINAFASVESKLDNNINQMMDEIMKLPIVDPQKAASSNPYIYIEDNKYYDNIVALGADALPYLKERVINSKNNGLKEYILAIAAEAIAKVDLKGNDFRWSNAKGWAAEWDKHLKKIKSNVETIANDPALSNNDKADKLVKLGTPAIPFIMDNIEKGNTELVIPLSQLLEGNGDVSFNKAEIKDIKEWVKLNKASFDNLRKLVEDAEKK